MFRMMHEDITRTMEEKVERVGEMEQFRGWVNNSYFHYHF